MIRFTDKIAQFIAEKELEYKDLTIILPSERAKKYVAASLFELHKRPIMAPKLVTMDAWIRKLSSKSIIDKTRALIRLFEVQLANAKEQHDQSFDEFLEWGPILLSDFDELDRYLVDVKTIFKDLHNIKDLEYWKIDAEEDFKVSDARKRFLEFWDRLPIYYEKLKDLLSKEDQTYMGAAYNEVATNIDLVFKENKNEHFVFAGFNALSKAESLIMKQLDRMGRGHIIVDADAFYFNNYNHEAGAFIRKQIADLDVKTIPFIEDVLSTKSMKIEVVECAQYTGQIKVAASRLLEMNEHQIAETLVLLADEGLIAPFLKNIPKKVGKTNITLGMPMKGTAVKNWVDIIFSIQETRNCYEGSSFYFKDLKRFFNHPFILSCLTEEEKLQLQALEQKIVAHNWIFISEKSLQLSDRLIHLINSAGMKWAGDWKVAMRQIRYLNQRLYKDLSSENQFERALIHSFDSALIDFQNIVDEGIPMMSLRSFKSLFTQHWSSKGIAYHGNPIDGLQVMGLLETRLLDFKSIICIGMNEGTMPPTNPIQSMFPMDLRRYSGLPLPRDKQGLFAHHFYRLLHACEELLVTYSGTKEAIGSSEPSRYLLQLEKELLPLNANVNWKFRYYNVPMEEDHHVDLRCIQKDEQILQRLDEVFTRSMSFSTLSKYVRCSLDFYYRYVLEFGEEESVEEDMESNTFGTILHATLEELYGKHAKYDKEGNLNPKGGLPVTATDIDEMKLKLTAEVNRQFVRFFNDDVNAFKYGRNQLSYKIALDMLNNFLDEEKKFIQAPNTLIIHSLEKQIKLDFGFEYNGELKHFNLNGTIDRVDEVNGKLRLIDYKSGMADDTQVKWQLLSKNKSDESEILHIFEKADKFVQLAMYCYLYYQKEKRFPDTAGIFSMRRIKRGLIEMNLSNHSMQELIAVFPIWMTELLERIYDQEVPFEHTNKNPLTNFCTYCN